MKIKKIVSDVTIYNDYRFNSYSGLPKLSMDSKKNKDIMNSDTNIYEIRLPNNIRLRFNSVKSLLISLYEIINENQCEYIGVWEGYSDITDICCIFEKKGG